MRTLAIPIALILAACSGSPGGSASRSTDDAAAVVPADTGRVTIDGVQFPAAMAEAPPEIVEAYVFAAKHPEVLRYMPCYCGCHRIRHPHESNYDCFVDAIDDRGAVPRVDPDPMGFT